MKILQAITIFTIAAFLGGTYISHSLNGKSYYTFANKKFRDPAAVPKVFDLSHLKGSALNFAKKKRILLGSRILNQKDSIGIELGHFISRTQDGRKAFACEVYDRITLHFKANGFATNGKRPSMYVESKCQMNKNLSRIAPIWIPIAKILNENPGNVELNFMEKTPISLRFSHLIDEWPKHWSLIDVKLSGSGKELILSEKEMSTWSKRPMTISW